MTKPTLHISIGSTASYLQRNYLDRAETAAGADARRVLAELRQSAARSVSTDPLALQRVLMLLEPPLSDDELGHTDKPSPSELAAYNALTLFAQHMQSATKPAHTTECSFARACGRLQTLSESNSIKPRFDAMQSARDEASRVLHLRSLVTLLRSKELAFDYGSFARDLRSLQYPSRRDGILLRWGRGYAVGTLRPKAQRAAEAEPDITSPFATS
ncbi:type I-E CRISPR-associated protein Cse2/CasB [Corynebacterium sp. ACRQP]|uniref:type I-E CRISPR-associated protein Cse2/CasB n=1 Tax=Corynebacterium sp. ACRQP TaxID=2918195 RepID=UPI001EF665F3|nr:type I-E CRISPR-associated protein Cse2/CasB [Corynebacterium sp. ACRQP]MCG7236712.1 type I-E CRISPR-associated protein Cse2/CasB [Corynebacterium sp. ACRQP]